jgi:predicted dehydrogenase
MAGIAGSRATASRSGPIDLEGERGHIIGDHIFGTVSLVEGRTVTPLPVPPMLPTVREIVRDFARVLSAGLPMPIPLEEGLRAVALSQACYASAKAGTAVPVERIE